MIKKENHILQAGSNIRTAIEKLSNTGSKHAMTLFILDNNKVIGTLTDGDVRRGLLNGVQLDDPVDKIMFRHFRFLNKENHTLEYLQELKKKEIDILPMLNEKNELIRIIDLSKRRSILPLDAVIMAGGEGRRLRPLTIDTPKPLIKLADKSIIDYNIDRLEDFGVDTFYITVNYLKDKIKKHLGDGSQRGISIDYVNEEEPLGTIGSAGLIQEFRHDAVLVMNSDLLTNIDFEDMYRTFIESTADMAVASTSYNLNVPYGIFELDGNRILNMKEKPTYTFHSNAGIYIVRKEHMKLIPRNTFFNATDLMTHLISEKKNVVNYPIRGYWLDIGQHEDYRKAQEDIKHIRF